MLNWKQHKERSTIELIELIKKKNHYEDNSLPKEAFLAFYFRFQQEVLNKCEIISKYYGFDNEVAVQITKDTFDRFLKYPNYDHSKSNCIDVDKGVILYLYRIAQNLLINYYHKENGINVSPYDGSEEIIYDYPDIKDDSTYNKVELLEHYSIVKMALSKLSPKHKIIYLTYKAYEKNGHTLPRELLADMREKLNLSQNTIRSYKYEAYNKVIEYLEIHGIRTNGK